MMYDMVTGRHHRAVYPVLSYTSSNSNTPYLARKYYYETAKPVGPPPEYHLFYDQITGMPVKWRINHTGARANPHVLIAGKTRKSGKTTLGNHILYHELNRGAFVLVFDPKGEYFGIDPMPVPEERIYRAGFGSWDIPPKIKPSTMTYDMWQPLIERYMLGKGYKTTITILMKVAKEIKKKEGIFNFDNALKEIESLSKQKTGISSREWVGINWQMEDFFDTMTELELFDEENGIDMQDLLTNYDAAVFSTKAPEDQTHLSLLITNLLKQLFKLKTDADTRHGKGDPSFWKRRVWLVVDEGGDPSVGPVNTESKLSCRPVVEQVFGKYAYANIMGMVITQHLQHISTKVIGACQNIFIGRLDEPNAIGKVSQLSGISRGWLEVMFKQFEVGNFIDPMHFDRDGLPRIYDVALVQGFTRAG